MVTASTHPDTTRGQPEPNSRSFAPWHAALRMRIVRGHYALHSDRRPAGFAFFAAREEAPAWYVARPRAAAVGEAGHLS